MCIYKLGLIYVRLFLYLVHLNWEYSTTNFGVITPEIFLVFAYRKRNDFQPFICKACTLQVCSFTVSFERVCFLWNKRFFLLCCSFWRDWNHWSQFNNAVLLPNTCTYYLQICRHSLWKLTLLYCFWQFLSITFFNH